MVLNNLFDYSLSPDPTEPVSIHQTQVNAALAANKGGFGELYARLAKEGKNPGQITETLRTSMKALRKQAIAKPQGAQMFPSKLGLSPVPKEGKHASGPTEAQQKVFIDLEKAGVTCPGVKFIKVLH